MFATEPCRPSLVRGRAAQVNPGGFTTPARRPSVPHRTAGCGKSSLRPLMAGSSPSLPDGSNPSAAIVQSASDVQCSRLLKTTQVDWNLIYKHVKILV
ncbi:transposase [Salmonella enterica subsp. enterica serovar Senftenberg]|nr:transposase [Salmonella enterica subsp. enterica serovar Senftenberg]HAB7007026.1 transposase [Salmonella enterica subsp. enterica serovar Senftenberg]